MAPRSALRTVIAATLFVAVFLTAGLLASVALAPSASAQTGGSDGATTTSSVVAEVPVPHIIPRPNSGTPPTDAGDRGGWLQGTIFFIICAGVLVIGALVVRESRKARAERGF